MPKKVLITLSLMGAALCNQDYMKTVFAEESRPSALLERSSVKIAITMENLNLREDFLQYPHLRQIRNFRFLYKQEAS